MAAMDHDVLKRFTWRAKVSCVRHIIGKRETASWQAVKELLKKVCHWAQ
jgi:hypothetical protein